MGFRFKAHEPIKDAVVRVVSEEVETAVEALSASSAQGRDKAIHEARKSLKKIRGLLKLVRPEIGSATYRKENGALRTIGLALSELRDAGAIIETFDHLTGKYRQDVKGSGLQAIRKALTSAKREKERSLKVAKVMADSADGLRTLLDRVADWPLTHDGFSAIASGLKASYRDGRRAMKRAQHSGSAVHFHEWRKRAKDHWYHTRLLENVWNDAMKAREESVRELESALGEDHNLFVLCEQLAHDPEQYGGNEAVELFAALAHNEQEELRARAIALGALLYEEKPKAFLRSAEKLWHKAEKIPPPAPAAKTARKQVA